MTEDKPRFWFPAMNYGWGWGFPVRWQGWVVFGSYFASIYAGVKYFHPRNDIGGFMIAFAVATVVFVAVIVWKGERPVAWRWGGK